MPIDPQTRQMQEVVTPMSSLKSTPKSAKSPNVSEQPNSVYDVNKDNTVSTSEQLANFNSGIEANWAKKFNINIEAFFQSIKISKIPSMVEISNVDSKVSQNIQAAKQYVREQILLLAEKGMKSTENEANKQVNE